jgi:ribosome biogenesis GTPase
LEYKLNLIQKEVFRVVFESRENYRLVDSNGNVLAGEISGTYRNSEMPWPVVGDWVSGRRLPGETGDWLLIEAIEERKTVIKRKDADGRSSRNQILAANVDVLFIVTSANDDFNLNRVERYLSLVAAEEIQPVILLNKIETGGEAENYLAELKSRFPSLPVAGVSALTGQLGPIRDFMKAGTTVTFVGSSGVGKSSLINAVLGRQHMHTGEIREDDSKGRHTTTHRELIFTADGAAIIDTPGLRSVGLTEDSQMGEWFSDVENLFSQCKFADCSHNTEPGCAVQNALALGRLDISKWENYLQMQKEIRFEKRKSDKALQSEEKKKWAKIGQTFKKIKKERER